MNATTTTAATRWREAKAILAAALDEPSSEQRLALVRHRCGEDVKLFREVSSLLDQTTTAMESFVDKAAAPLRRDIATLEPGIRIGAYVIVHELGRGGMGAVYLARRADGAFDKQVALKILKRGTDTEEVLRRFRAERQILARLDHPNIARLLDAGTTSEGLPYLAMDYVEGTPITTYASDCKLPVTQRLTLFRSVCAAVGYAHQNLVVHRDLKPSNVLVSASGEVKLLDFGIAKLLDDSAPEVTVTIQRRLTPTYASPEQVRGETVTTVSDIYSLGVLLYELLTGERPYMARTTNAEQLTNVICEQEPQRPSTTCARTKSTYALSYKLLRGDLDNIVLKALRKEPSRRYPSVDQFSDDVRRHMEGLAVGARKGNAGYRALKFIRRHKVSVAAAVVVGIALLAGSVTTVYQARKAEREKKLAEQRFEQVRKLAHSVLFDYYDKIATLPGSTKVREQLIKDSLGYLDELSRQAGSNHELLCEIASAYERIAAVQNGAAVTIASDNAGIKVGWHLDGGRLEQVMSHLAEAKSAYQRSLSIYDELKRNGVVTPADANKRDELMRKIADCDTALRQRAE